LALTHQVLAQRNEDKRPVTASEIQLLLTAIRDEIYARGYAPNYFDMPTDSIPVYVDPQLRDKLIWAIYKLPPFGEVRRGAWFSPDHRLAILLGDPDDGFPPTHPTAMLTMYLDDDDVIKMKTTWKRAWVRIESQPSSAELTAAKEREAIRGSIRGLGR
jgi:hypothetical protein